MAAASPRNRQRSRAVACGGRINLFFTATRSNRRKRLLSRITSLQTLQTRRSQSAANLSSSCPSEQNRYGPLKR
jgi:hypothetical protein